MIPLEFIKNKLYLNDQIKENNIENNFKTNLIAYNIKLNDNNKTVSFNTDFYKSINKYLSKVYTFCVTGSYADENFYDMYYNKKFQNQDKQLLNSSWIYKNLNANIFLIKSKIKFMKS